MRDRIFALFAAAAGKRPWWVVLVALVLTVVAGGLSESLRMETRVFDLIPKDDPAAVEFDNIIRQYSSASQIIVGIEGKNKAQMIAFADALDKRAKGAMYTDRESGEKKSYVKRITVKADAEYIAEHGMMLIKERDLQNLEEVFQDLDMASLLTAYNDFLEREYIEDSSSVTDREKEDGAIDQLKNILHWLEGVASSGDTGDDRKLYADEATDLLTTGNPYLFSDDNRMLLAMVMPSVSIDKLDETLEGVVALREIINDIKGDSSDLKVRMTGMPVLMLEETEVVLEDMGISSIVALVLVLVLFVLAFRMWTAPLLAIINLIVGIVWTTGVVAIAIGRLNLFTFMFAVILIGLGIDFAIHLNAAFSTARGEGKSLEESLREMYRRAGPGVVTGALTTAAAFLALIFTGLDALMELGIVLGAGILLTLLASLTLLPAMFAIHYRAGMRLKKDEKPKPSILTFGFLGALGQAIGRRPWTVFVLFMIASMGFVYAVRNASFQPDMLEIEPPDMPSVTLHREILKKFELHPDYAMVTSNDFDRTRTMVKKLKKNRLVGRVEAITELLPSQKEQKRRGRIATRLQDRMDEIMAPVEIPQEVGETVMTRPPEFQTKERVSKEALSTIYKELDRLQMNVQEIGQMAFASVKMRLHRTCDWLSGGDNPAFSPILQLKKKWQKISDIDQKIAGYERVYIPMMAGKIKKMANTETITFETLPQNIKDRFMSDEGANLVTIYSSVDLWHEGKTELFVNATQKASDRVTGTAVLTDRLITLIGEKGLLATFLALGAVFIILLIDFRHVGYALLGAVPLLAGFAWMVGLFVLMGRQFDVVNVTALPLILGIGIDDAVHVIHAIRRQGTHALSEVLRHTGRALLLTSLTTGIAFYAIAVSSHRGMAGMGILLVLGVVSCFIASVVLLPALVRIFFNKRASQSTEAQ